MDTTHRQQPLANLQQMTEMVARAQRQTKGLRQTAELYYHRAHYLAAQIDALSANRLRHELNLPEVSNASPVRSDSRLSRQNFGVDTTSCTRPGTWCCAGWCRRRHRHPGRLSEQSYQSRCICH
ncbi:MAG: hypothetical protein IPM39_28590 [Chloroflexi bacterium]|nr:hypothetical protein [Chloroflexota bacterium]